VYSATTIWLELPSPPDQLAVTECAPDATPEIVQIVIPPAPPPAMLDLQLMLVPLSVTEDGAVEVPDVIRVVSECPETTPDKEQVFELTLPTMHEDALA
jgi:hypothetical protein